MLTIKKIKSFFKKGDKKIIWLCWFQGLGDEDMPELNRLCVDKWIELNPDCIVRVIDNDNICNYVPEFFEIIEKSPPRDHTSRSELLRILLLSKFGGVWVDASVMPLFPLSFFYDKIVNKTGFFAFRFSPRLKDVKGYRECASWFICASHPNHYLINLWKICYISRFMSRRKYKYFCFHDALCFIYDNDEKSRSIIEDMVEININKESRWINAVNKREVDLESKDFFMYKRPNIKKT